MRWTPEKIDELREFAHLGSAKLGVRFGVSAKAIIAAATSREIHIGPRRTRAMIEAMIEREWRERWEAMLPDMKEAVRADILRDAA